MRPKEVEMGWLRLLGRRRTPPEIVAPEEAPCPHVALQAHWDSAADMGVEERASRYTCMACGTVFGPEDARRIRATEAERLRKELSTN